MPSKSLQLLPGTGESAADLLRSFRLRPGERATWIDVSASDTEARRWRTAAASVGLSVDVWIALKLEWSLIRADVPDQTRLAAVVHEACRESEALRLAPSDDFRRWLAFLGRGAQLEADDDLPSVALPARVVARIPPADLTTNVVAVAKEALDPAAVAVERTASLNGMTMESWAYRALARLQ